MPPGAYAHATVSTTTSNRESYAQWLRREMDERGVSLRELARRLGPNDPETWRRSLRRYLKGMVPLAKTKERIAAALGSEATGPDADLEDD